MNLILDMDGTLIDNYYCAKTKNTIIVPRPYLKEFFDFVFENFIYVSIWTHGVREWYDEVYEKVFKYYIPAGKSFHFVRSRKNYYYTTLLKPLSKIYKKYPEYNCFNTLILDDNPGTYANNIENAVPINSFLYFCEDEDDKEYLELQDNELLNILSLFKILVFRILPTEM